MKNNDVNAYKEYVNWLKTQKFTNKFQPDIVSRLKLCARKHNTTVRGMLNVKREVQSINESFKRHVRWGPRTK